MLAGVLVAMTESMPLGILQILYSQRIASKMGILGCSVEAALQGFGTLTNKMNKMKPIDAVIGPGCSVGCEVQA